MVTGCLWGHPLKLIYNIKPSGGDTSISVGSWPPTEQAPQLIRAENMEYGSLAFHHAVFDLLKVPVK